jgi:YcxB-like protein
MVSGPRWESAALPVSPVVAFLFGAAWQHLIRRNVARAARQAGEQFVCEHELRLTDSELIESTNSTEHRIVYPAIAQVERVGDRAFIFVDKLLAHVIPVRQVTEANAEAFLAELELRRFSKLRPTCAGRDRRGDDEGSRLSGKTLASVMKSLETESECSAVRKGTRETLPTLSTESVP